MIGELGAMSRRRRHAVLARLSAAERKRVAELLTRADGPNDAAAQRETAVPVRFSAWLEERLAPDAGAAAWRMTDAAREALREAARGQVFETSPPARSAETRSLFSQLAGMAAATWRGR